VRRTTSQRRQEQLVACIDLYGKSSLDDGERSQLWMADPSTV
jgi:hypothetical protein